LVPGFALLTALFVALTLAQTPPTGVDGPEFAVPFGCGLQYPVSQAHAVGSHLNNDTYAWDFKMPEGVPIVAAADGVVRMARGDSTVGGCDVKFASSANYVVITHPNGLETQYLHFERVVVHPGDPVKKGDLIGFSGKTGWACGSHLHFKVAQAAGTGWNNPSVLARLVGHGDPVAGVLIRAPECKDETLRVMMASGEQQKPSGQGGSDVKQQEVPPSNAQGPLGKRVLNVLAEGAR
jgi:murein DD-endopeptidase MepM/ murein hydrolase activator NlpD